MGMLIRTIGINRAEAKITFVNLAHNMNRLIFQERRAAGGGVSENLGTTAKGQKKRRTVG